VLSSREGHSRTVARKGRPLRVGHPEEHRQRAAEREAPRVEDAHGPQPGAEDRGQRPGRVAQAERPRGSRAGRAVDREAVRVVAPDARRELTERNAVEARSAPTHTSTGRSRLQ